MNFRKFIRWPSPLNVAVHLRRVGELLSNSSPTVSLSDAETRCAAEISFLPQRNVFLASRKLTRQVLAVPLDCAPEAVPIIGESDERPVLVADGIQFNLSHCEDWCALAWSAETPVGVDVETIRPVPGMTEIVSNFFPPAARRAFDAAKPQNQTKVFFRWWTQIEAALKVSGRGLDDSYACLDKVLHATCEAVPGVALAIAAEGKGPLTITWDLP